MRQTQPREPSRLGRSLPETLGGQEGRRGWGPEVGGGSEDMCGSIISAAEPVSNRKV